MVPHGGVPGHISQRTAPAAPPSARERFQPWLIFGRGVAGGRRGPRLARSGRRLDPRSTSQPGPRAPATAPERRGPRTRPADRARHGRPGPAATASPTPRPGPQSAPIPRAVPGRGRTQWRDRRLARTPGRPPALARRGRTACSGPGRPGAAGRGCSVLPPGNPRRAVRSGGGLGLYRRDDPDVTAELEDEVVQVGGCHGPQGGELGGGLFVVEDVERPVACGAAAQVGVVERGAVVGAQGYRRDARGLLERPAQGPLSLGAPGGLRPHAGGGDLPGAQQQVPVDLIERAARVRVDERDGFGEQLFLLAPGTGPAVGAGAEVGEMAQQGACRVRGRYWHRVLPFQARLNCNQCTLTSAAAGPTRTVTSGGAKVDGL